jgi:hypothetical protein
VIVSGSVKGRISFLANTVGLTRQAIVSGDINYCDLVVECQATLVARVHRISRACWDANAVEHPRTISESAQVVDRFGTVIRGTRAGPRSWPLRRCQERSAGR